jgi:hypothetical protein
MQTVSAPLPVPATATTSDTSGKSPPSQASMTISQQTFTPSPKRLNDCATIIVGYSPLNFCANAVSIECVSIVPV